VTRKAASESVRLASSLRLWAYHFGRACRRARPASRPSRALPPRPPARRSRPSRRELPSRTPATANAATGPPRPRRHRRPARARPARRPSSPPAPSSSPPSSPSSPKQLPPRRADERPDTLRPFSPPPYPQRTLALALATTSNTPSANLLQVDSRPKAASPCCNIPTAGARGCWRGLSSFCCAIWRSMDFSH
jgi:S-DNA-T family DNA segregation ATPase FtsK/SpoIIIE